MLINNNNNKQKMYIVNFTSRAKWEKLLDSGRVVTILCLAVWVQALSTLEKVLLNEADPRLC